MVTDAADGGSSLPAFGENRPRGVSAGVLGFAWHLAHHQDLLQGFLHVLVHLTLKAQ